MISSLEEFKVYGLAMSLGEEVWEVVSNWSYFEKNTVGIQFVKAADSIASNLSDGLGRYHYREAKNFSYYSRGSLFETKTWVTKAHSRKLLSDSKFKSLSDQMETIGRMINGYIRSIGVPNA